MKEGNSMSNIGTCPNCGKENVEIIKYTKRYPNIKCQCHGPHHYDVLEMCWDCANGKTELRPYISNLYINAEQLDALDQIVTRFKANVNHNEDVRIKLRQTETLHRHLIKAAKKILGEDYHTELNSGYDDMLHSDITVIEQIIEKFETKEKKTLWNNIVELFGGSING